MHPRKWFTLSLTAMIVCALQAPGWGAITREDETDDEGDGTVTFYSDEHDVAERLRSKLSFMLIQMPDTKAFEPSDGVTLYLEYRSTNMSNLANLNRDEVERLFRFKDRHLRIVADGQTYNIGDMRHSGRSYGFYVGESLSIDVPTKTFLALAKANNIKLDVGGQAFDLAAGMQDDVRELSKEVHKHVPAK